VSATVAELRHGRVGRLAHAGKHEPSAIAKLRTPGPLVLGPLGLDGDEVGDTRNHGGRDKAVCVYPAERYAAWEARYGRALPRPAFGENLLVEGQDEATVRVGDVFTLGTARVQVSQPRVPCYKPAVFTGERRLTVDLRETGWTGWYLRVLEGGVVAEGDELVLVERADGALDVLTLNRLRYGPRDPEALRAAAATPALMPAWREALLTLARGRGDPDD
jgi:MOSC domain-containing protein YiiM